MFQYTCATCGKVHQGAPGFSFTAPASFDFSLKSPNQHLNDDLCRIDEHNFVRVILEIPIQHTKEVFTWGVWVSQSEENYSFYAKNFGKNLVGRETFGWFSNILPHYPNTANLKCKVVFQQKGLRPKIELERTEHELAQDFYNGISQEKAIKIAQIAMHQYQNNSK